MSSMKDICTQVLLPTVADIRRATVVETAPNSKHASAEGMQLKLVEPPVIQVQAGNMEQESAPGS